METNENAGRRTSLVTGGTGGIGRAVAIRLAAGGDRVLFTGRDHRRAAVVLGELHRSGPDAGHRFLPADLALLGETAELAQSVAAVTDRLDAVVCCAGLFSTVTAYTGEGLERTFVINYLSHYLLVRRLLPLLLAAPSPRVVLVANAGMYPDTIDLDDLQHRRGRPGLAVAGRTQFANDLLAVELAERYGGDGVQVTCVYPGIVRTEVFANAVGLGPVARTLIRTLNRVVGASPEKAAFAPAFLASAPEAGDLGGRFFGPRLREVRVPARVRRPDRRAGLWAASEALVRDHLRAGADDRTSFPSPELAPE
jgi:NAD(P)-dependent dehydrogenase (short-subunit alcohol dehydrogenase family)